METVKGVSEAQSEALPNTEDSYESTSIDQQEIDSYKNIGISGISHQSIGKSHADSGRVFGQEEKVIYKSAFALRTILFNFFRRRI